MAWPFCSTVWLVFATLAIVVSLAAADGAAAAASASDTLVCSSSHHTREDRAALFDYLLDSTLTKQAFNSSTHCRNVIKAMKRERAAFIDAESDQELYFALVRLSNLRKDAHLSVKPTSAAVKKKKKLEQGDDNHKDEDDDDDDGLWLTDYWGPRIVARHRSSQRQQLLSEDRHETPIQFDTDYVDHSIFVSDVAQLVGDDGQDGTDVCEVLQNVQIGDTLVAINHVPIRDYIQRLEPYIRYSTTHGLWCKIAKRINQYHLFQTPPSFYNHTRNNHDGTTTSSRPSMTYTLQRRRQANTNSHDQTASSTTDSSALPSLHTYPITLSFVPRKDITWTGYGYGQPTYPEFRLVDKRTCFTIFVKDVVHEQHSNNNNKKAKSSVVVWLLQWHAFDEQTLVQDVHHFLDVIANKYCQKEDSDSDHQQQQQQHALILDFLKSRGGAKGPYALQHLLNQPFRTTMGNLNLCAGNDLIRDFLKQQQKENLGYYARTTTPSRNKEGTNVSSTTTATADDNNTTLLDDGTWLMDWLEQRVLPALNDRNDKSEKDTANMNTDSHHDHDQACYTDSVPFKLTHAPMDSDGTLYPAAKLPHFFQSKNVVALFGPHGSSQVDQVAAILIDNAHLGVHTIGMPTGGFSNTWEWTETLWWSRTGADRNSLPIVDYQWSIGQTLRPNGQVLQGNPPMVHEYVPQTREKYLNYRNDLVDRALKHLGLG